MFGTCIITQHSTNAILVLCQETFAILQQSTNRRVDGAEFELVRCAISMSAELSAITLIACVCLRSENFAGMTKIFLSKAFKETGCEQVMKIAIDLGLL